MINFTYVVGILISTLQLLTFIWLCSFTSLPALIPPRTLWTSAAVKFVPKWILPQIVPSSTALKALMLSLYCKRFNVGSSVNAERYLHEKLWNSQPSLKSQLLPNGSISSLTTPNGRLLGFRPIATQKKQICTAGSMNAKNRVLKMNIITVKREEVARN